MTLKYNHSNWKWYECVKLNEYYHQAKFDIYHADSDQENRNVKVFITYRQTVRQLNADHYILDSHV